MIFVEYASSSESEDEVQLMESVCRMDQDSDCESIDSEQEDPLKYEWDISLMDGDDWWRDKYNYGHGG